FHDTYTELPPHRGAKFDKAGKPLLSWRVYILPFIEEQELFERFHLDEPWDSEHNKPLAELMPRVLRNSNVKLDSKAHTTYVLPINAKSMFDGKTGISFGDVTDGLSNTIMVLEVSPEKAVVWTKPDDWEVNTDKPLEGLGALTDQGVWVLLGDGSVQQILPQADPAEFLKMLLRNDRQPIAFDKLKRK
ncbi:MAG TPA: DUF1559 domain-containing protein, partial [Pirellulaceae bacterium]|nr:DUF1559 domain-containing protein [Pirellulaceae bacterium]